MIRLTVILIFWAGAALAQSDITVREAAVADTRNGVTVTLTLSDIAPYRVFTLDDPRRLVLDIEGLALQGFEADVLAASNRFAAVRAGPFRPGWARVIFDLSSPTALNAAGMVRIEAGASLTLTLGEVTEAAFADAAGAPPDPGWEEATGFDPAEAQRLAAGTDFLVVLDPAHGGIDAGVTIGGVKEADLTLITAQELAVRLNAIDGISATLLRNGDDYIDASARQELIRQVGADLVLAFHAGAESERGVRVASYAPGAGPLHGHSDTDQDAGVTSQVDPLASALNDLARAETQPEGARIADAMVAAFGRVGVPLPREPRINADSDILRDPAVPAVAVILGSLADPSDRAFLVSTAGRDRLAEAIAGTVRLLAR